MPSSLHVTAHSSHMQASRPTVEYWLPKANAAYMLVKPHGTVCNLLYVRLECRAGHLPGNHEGITRGLGGQQVPALPSAGAICGCRQGC